MKRDDLFTELRSYGLSGALEDMLAEDFSTPDITNYIYENIDSSAGGLDNHIQKSENTLQIIGLPDVDILNYTRNIDGVLTDTIGVLSTVVLSNWSIPVLARPLIPSYVLPTKSSGDATYTIGPGQTYETFADLVAAVTLQPGDIVDGGGNTFTDQWSIPNISGAVGNHIIYRNATIDVSAKTTEYCILTGASSNYIQFEDLDLIGCGGADAFNINGTSGSAGLGYTVACINVNILSNHGAGSGDHDGFNLDVDSQLLLYKCSSTKCRPEPQSAGSHQAITAHTNSKVIAVDCNFSDSNNLYTGVGDSEAYFYNCDFTLAYVAMVDVAQTARCIVDNSTFTENGTGEFSGIDGTTCRLSIVNSTINITASNLIFWRGGTLELFNNHFTITGDPRWYTFNAACEVYCHDNVFDIAGVNSPLFRLDVAGSYLYFYDNYVKMQSAGDDFIYFKNASGSIEGNVFDSFTGSSLFWVVGTIDADVKIRRNIFYNCGQILDNDLTGVELYNINLKYNVFQDCSDVYTSLNNVTSDYNCYYNSENAGGANSIISAPLLTDPANDDFSISESSPLITANIAELADLAITIHSGSDVSDWVVSLPEHPELITVLSAFATLYDSTNVAHQVTWAQLTAAADDHYLFVGPKSVVTYKTDSSRVASKINRYIGNT